MESVQREKAGNATSKRKKANKLSFRARNPEATKERIMISAIKEFSIHGLNGARVQNIAKNADTNMRMIYHYYTDKEGLYIAALERVYRDVRASEQELHIEDDDPIVGLNRLINFTFQHFVAHPDLINLVMGENLLRGQYLVKSDLVPTMSARLRSSVKALLERGTKAGVFRKSVDPMQLWVTIFALCWVHLSNKYTLSWMLQADLTDAEWLEQRRQHVVDVVTAYLCCPVETGKVNSRSVSAPRKLKGKR